MARTTPDKVELKRNIANIKKFLQREDCGMIDSGIELARSLDQESIFEEFLKDCKIYEGSLGMDSTHKGNDAEVGWMNLRMHDTLQSIQANIEHYWDY